MAIRFGVPPVAPARAALSRALQRTRWITRAALPLLPLAFFQDAAGMAANLAGFAAIAGGMWLTREGLAAADAYEARPVARRPALPRKLLGAGATGLGLALAVAEPGNPGAAALVGLVGAVLHVLTFGLDPMRDKLPEGIDGVQRGRALRLRAEADAALAQMRASVAPLNDPSLTIELDRLAAAAHRLLARVEDDPAEIASVRRSLGIYLAGARDATAKFAALYSASRSPLARQAWAGLLSDLGASFTRQAETLAAGRQQDMELEIAVLRERLAADSLPPPAPQDAPGPDFAALRRDLARAPR